jgi:predicted TIM-barrel fold metal-dependent hydrolase
MMPSRRDVLLGSLAAGVAALSRTAAASVGPSQPTTPVNFKVPAGACDCHVHVFGDPKRFPLSPTRTYTPEPASVEQVRALHRALHIDRVLLVQPSIFGTDNACLLDALRQLGSRARGVVVIDTATSGRTLDDMHRAGVRGVRINLGTAGVTDPTVARQRFLATVQRVKDRRWHIQMFTQLSVIDAISDDLGASPVPIVFDHFAQAQAAAGVQQPGFSTLLKLVTGGQAYVKVSGPYMGSANAPDYSDMAPLARALMAANARRILWGTNWPHANSAPPPGGTATDITPLLRIDDGRILNQFAVWAPDAGLRKTILVDNPAELYGF